MQQKPKTLWPVFFLLLTSACGTLDGGVAPLGSVLSQADQDALTPTAVRPELEEGNGRFVSNDLTRRDHSSQVRMASTGQFPKAIVLSCVDSRVPVEDVFDCSIGDLFVARVAGNVVNTDILGSMEFACHVAGAKLILVLGHEHCGAVKAAIDGVQLGDITAMLTNIRPAVTGLVADGERTAKNTVFVHMVAEANVRRAVEQMRRRSSILAGMEAEGKIAIQGALYDMDTGRVTWLD